MIRAVDGLGKHQVLVAERAVACRASVSVLDHARSEGARWRAVVRLSEEAPSWFAPAEDADTHGFREALTAALSALPLEQRTVVHLKLWEGRTFEEIAALLELPLNTAASRYRYGIANLRTTLRPLNFDTLPAPVYAGPLPRPTPAEIERQFARHRAEITSLLALLDPTQLRAADAPFHRNPPSPDVL